MCRFIRRKLIVALVPFVGVQPVYGIPLDHIKVSPIIPREDLRNVTSVSQVSLDEPPHQRTLVVAVCMVYMFLLAIAQGMTYFFFGGAWIG